MVLYRKTFYIGVKPRTGISKRINIETLMNAEKILEKKYSTTRNDHIINADTQKVRYLIHGTYVENKENYIEIQHETKAGLTAMIRELELE